MIVKLSITKTDRLKARPKDTELGFGTVFTDHMFNMDYNPDKGWHNPRIEPYQPIHMEPSTMVLHYGQAIFEGLKAFRTPENQIQLFRPRDNFKRLNLSARTMCIPEFDEELALEGLKQLIRLEKDWVPKELGTSLYIRPTIIATDPFLGVRASHTYRFFIILSPVGAYYAEGFNPVKIWVTKDHVRAVRGGVGFVKTAGNYAASLFAGEEAHKNGYTQVLWLDGVELKYIEEVGSMNIFFVIGNELVTPALNGSILSGITRDSVIAMAKKQNMPVNERRISIDELFDAHAAGTLQEAFGSGTAAVISPVGLIKYDNKIIEIGDGKVGPIANRFFKDLTDIQYGKVDAPEGWIEKITA
ncbi:MAG: branched-chain amino acid aminotransferase [Pseudomonadota bacterium]